MFAFAVCIPSVETKNVLGGRGPALCVASTYPFLFLGHNQGVPYNANSNNNCGSVLNRAEKQHCRQIVTMGKYFQ
jgi:hypothetical protein